MAIELGTRVVDLDGPVRSDLEDWPGRLGLHVQMFEVSLAGAFPYSIGKLDVLAQIAADASFYSQDRSYPSALLPQVCQASCYCHIDTKGRRRRRRCCRGCQRKLVSILISCAAK